ncbi:FAD-binding oxidoreductase [Kibdelosporangium aridum]|uniref:FAD/FMN-containing dehydrogenase n=1 Tax=Kibdelosporangium aridum TaxID=2030 RepID=A0A1W2FX95_KIBAR|nr:FAD-binding oxidoreductase [Kibdelosporangium aridum]SMD26550.1 FAD/FMN-containing dehydrogenase [Kibdelosporangium aridum]
MTIDSPASLGAALRGRIALPGDEDYDKARTGWNLTVEHHPEVIVLAEDTADVVEAVRYASRADLPIAVQSTGHGISVPADGAVYINTSRLAGVTVDSDARTARIEAGLRWGQVIEAAISHGLAPLCGSSTYIGVMGYLTGGGLPVLARTYGFAANTVRSLDVVTADGELRTTSPEREPDLFWAVRGGKSNFGVVVAAEIDLLNLPRIYGGSLFFDGKHAERVLPTYIDWTSTLPDEMTSSIIFIRYPDIPMMPAEIRGRFFTTVRIAYAGDPAEGERLVAPLRALGPELDEVADMSYADIEEIYHDPFRPTPANNRSALLTDLDDTAVEKLIGLLGPDNDVPFGGVELRHLGGALARPLTRDAAVGRQDAAFHMFASLPARMNATHYRERVLRTLSELVRVLGPWDTGRMLPGFMFNDDTTSEAVRRGYADADYQRLVDVKTTYDPRNLFRVNHNIPPR